MNKTYKITSIFLALFLSFSMVAPVAEAGFMEGIFGFLGINDAGDDFSPEINIEFSNPTTNELTDITFEVTQDPDEIDMASLILESDGGSLNIENLFIGQVVGNSSTYFGGGEYGGPNSFETIIEVVYLNESEQIVGLVGNITNTNATSYPFNTTGFSIAYLNITSSDEGIDIGPLEFFNMTDGSTAGNGNIVFLKDIVINPSSENVTITSTAVSYYGNESNTSTIIQLNNRPVADDVEVETNENIVANITLNATDADGDNLTYSVVSNATHGSVEIINNMAIYTPETGYIGEDLFNYIVNDGELDSEEATVTITVNNVFLGGVSVISSTNLGDLILDEQKNITLTLRSEEEFSQTISLGYSIEDLVDEDYMDESMISFDQESYTLENEGDEVNITLIIEPNSRYQYVADNFEGRILVKNASETLIESIPVDFDVETEVYEITDIDLNPNTELEPGDNFDIDVDVKNIIGFDLDDVKLKVSVKDIDDGKDIDEETTINNLDDGEKESENFDFEDVGIPYNVDAIKYDVTLKLTGEAEDNDDGYNGKVYFLFREFVDVEKDEDEDISIINIEMLQTILNCGSSSTIQFTSVNTGKDDLDDSYMKLTVNELNISESSVAFDLEYNDYDDREKDIVFLLIVPENATEGNYTAKIWAYTEDDDLIGYNTIDFNVVGNCAASDNGEDQSADEGTNEESDSGNGWEEVTGYTFLSTEFFGSDAFKTVFWILGDLVLVIVAIYFVRRILKG